MIRLVHPSGKLMTLAEIEKGAIEFALWHFAGNVARSHKALGIGKSTFYRKLDNYNLRHLLTHDYTRPIPRDGGFLEPGGVSTLLGARLTHPWGKDDE